MIKANNKYNSNDTNNNKNDDDKEKQPLELMTSIQGIPHHRIKDRVLLTGSNTHLGAHKKESSW